MSKQVLNPTKVSAPPDSIVFGCSEAMAAIRRNLVKIADTNIPVLLTGESGTGKEIICKYLHHNSVWGKGPFVKLDCPAIPGTLLESELFGHERGAFTGAIGERTGRIASAESGTLFLDEISDLDISLQVKLLQVLQDGQFQPIGATRGKKVNVRIVCATNRQLQTEIESGRFRQDLYFRIAGLVLKLPPLRERLDDLGLLVNYFVGTYNAQFERNMPPVSEFSLMLMRTHAWPGNVRELENLVKRYVVLGTEEAILRELGHAETRSNPPVQGRRAELSLTQRTRAAATDMECRIILDALRNHQWDRRRAADALKLSYRSLLYKMKKAGIEGHYGSQTFGAPHPLRNLP